MVEYEIVLAIWLSCNVNICTIIDMHNVVNYVEVLLLLLLLSLELLLNLLSTVLKALSSNLLLRRHIIISILRSLIGIVVSLLSF